MNDQLSFHLSIRMRSYVVEWCHFFAAVKTTTQNIGMKRKGCKIWRFCTDEISLFKLNMDLNQYPCYNFMDSFYLFYFKKVCIGVAYPKKLNFSMQ